MTGTFWSKITLVFLLHILLVDLQLANAQSAIGTSELDRLVSQHRPHPLAGNTRSSLDVVERQITIPDIVDPVTFSIPGFEFYGCGKCHTVDKLIETATARMRFVTQTIGRHTAKKVPLRQYIIQTYSDNLLHEQQFAHATFDTIRLFPRTIIIDTKVYNLATHLHETLHLTQLFLGHVNELEAYGLNALSDPRFLILNYPYFDDVTRFFFVPDLASVLKTYFSREVKESLSIPREVQWYMLPFDKLGNVAAAIVKMQPLLAEVSRINREHPLEIAYLSDQTGVRSLALELTAVKQLPLPPLTVSDDLRSRAFEVLALQMAKTDNTRLGYVIDRKKEALMTLQHQLAVNDPNECLLLYFHYLKQRFILPNDEIKLEPEDREDFQQYLRVKVEQIRSMLQYEGITPVERSAGRQWEQTIKDLLPANINPSRNPK